MKHRDKINLILMFLIPLIVYIGMFIFALPKANLMILYFVLISLLGLIIGLFLAVLLHEVGHGVLGHFAKYQLLSFKFLNFEIFRDEEDKLHLQINPLNGMVLGQCLMLPPKNKKHKLKRFYLYNAGGLTFSFIWSFLLIVFFALSNIYFRWLWMAMMLINTFLIINNICYSENGVNDRCNAEIIKKNPQYVDAINYQLRVVGNIYLGKRFGAKIEAKPYYEEKLNHISVPVVEFMMYHAIDHGDFETVKSLSLLLKQNYQRLIFPIQKVIINFDLMWVDLVVDGNRKTFERHFKRFTDREKLLCEKPDTDVNFYYRLYSQIYDKNFDLSAFIEEVKEAKCFYAGERLSLLKRLDYLSQTLCKEEAK